MLHIKKLINDKPLWDDFCEYLDGKIADAHRLMEQTNDLNDLLRYQGRVAAYRRLKQMRDELNG